MAGVSTPYAYQTTTELPERSGALPADPRLELVARITSTAAFHKAVKLQALLRYIVEQSIEDDQNEITEHRIGIEVFGKGPDYAPLLDSSVRVQARQLRLKLHEYFDGVGRAEPLILEIPKGSYRPAFRAAVEESEVMAAELSPLLTEENAEVDQITQESAPSASHSGWFPWAIATVSTAIAVLLVAGHVRQIQRSAPWPLSLVMKRGEVSHLILADSTYQITATANARSMDLGEYLRSKPRDNTAVDPKEPDDLRLAHALSGGTFTSFADVVMLNSLARAAGRYQLDLDVKSARDLDPRDLENGNFILVGSPSSNPWVNLYTSKLNFRETDDPERPGTKVFRNVRPQRAEPKFFAGTSSGDTVRTDYADLAIVPGLEEHGVVMIVQGLRHEATEAAARLLADPADSKMLEDAIRSAVQNGHPAYFEALLSVHAVAGIPEVTGIAAIRATYSK